MMTLYSYPGVLLPTLFLNAFVRDLGGHLDLHSTLVFDEPRQQIHAIWGTLTWPGRPPVPLRGSQETLPGHSSAYHSLDLALGELPDELKQPGTDTWDLGDTDDNERLTVKTTWWAGESNPLLSVCGTPALLTTLGFQVPQAPDSAPAADDTALGAALRQVQRDLQVARQQALAHSQDTARRDARARYVTHQLLLLLPERQRSQVQEQITDRLYPDVSDWSADLLDPHTDTNPWPVHAPGQAFPCVPAPFALHPESGATETTDPDLIF